MVLIRRHFLCAPYTFRCVKLKGVPPVSVL